MVTPSNPKTFTQFSFLFSLNLYPCKRTLLQLVSSDVCKYFPNTFSYFSSHIYHFNGCRIFHHVEIALFPSLAKGPHPARLVHPRLIWLQAFCKGWVEHRKRAFRWRVLEKYSLKGQQSCNSRGRGRATVLQAEIAKLLKRTYQAWESWYLLPYGSWFSSPNPSNPFIPSFMYSLLEQCILVKQRAIKQSWKQLYLAVDLALPGFWSLFKTLHKWTSQSPVSPQVCCKD